MNYWTFVSRFPKFSRHHDSPIYELSGGEAGLAELYLADNLFVIADGYTNQVRSREDLVRHGDLR